MKKLTPEQKMELQRVIDKLSTKPGPVTKESPFRLHRTRYEDWSHGHQKITEMFMYDFMVDKSVVDTFEYHYYEMIKNFLTDTKI